LVQETRPLRFLVIQQIVQNSKDLPIEPFGFAFYVLRITFYSLRLNPVDTRIRAGFFGMLIPLFRNSTVVFITIDMEHDKRNLPLHKTA
jgi:hypothetical protein